MLNIARLLRRVGKVAFVVTDNYERELDAKIPDFEFEIKLIARLNRSSPRTMKNWVKHELAAGCLETEGFEVCERDQRVMSRLMAESDIRWVHGLQTANMFGIYQWPRSILDIDDIPSRSFASRARTAETFSRKMINYRRALIWWHRERVLGKRFNITAVTSKADLRYLRRVSSVTVVPNGFNAPGEHYPKMLVDPPRIGFIGTLNWFPNKDGIEWFARQVWHHVKREVPSVRLRLVGEKSIQSFSSMGPDIDGLGWVEDPAREIATWSAMIVPIRCGAGTRVKIADAFSKKCPVVSTSLGAFGYEVLNGVDIMLADDSRRFASACVTLLKNANLGAILCENAWNKFRQNWTWDSIGKTVCDAVYQCQQQKD
jgi:polysaccharide biosynthesis protein PslH